MKKVLICLFFTLLYGMANAAPIIQDPNFTGEIIQEDGSFSFVDTADGSIEVFNTNTRKSYIYDKQGKIIKTDYFDKSGWYRFRDNDGAFYIVDSYSLEIIKYVNNVPVWKKSFEGEEENKIISDIKWDKNKEYIYIVYNVLDNTKNFTLLYFTLLCF